MAEEVRLSVKCKSCGLDPEEWLPVLERVKKRLNELEPGNDDK